MIRSMSRSLYFAAAAFAATAAPCFAGAPTTMIADATFNDPNWTTTLFTTGAGGTNTSVQDAGIGNPIPGRSVTHQMAAGTGTVIVFHEYIAGGTIDPSDRAIASITYSIDCRYISGVGGNGQQVGVAIEQGGIVYQAGNQSTGSTGAFVSRGATVVAADFSRADGMPGTPDFSTSGAPISVGFRTSNNTSGTGTFNQRVVYDNFSVVATTIEPTPALVHEYNFEGNIKDNASGADGTIGPSASYKSSINGDNVPFELGGALAVGTTHGGQDTASVPQANFMPFRTNNFTIAFWWQSDLGDTGDNDGLLDAGNSTGWRMQYTGGALRFREVGGPTFDSPPISLDGRPHHVAFVCDRLGSGTYTFYYDGVPIGSGSTAAMTDIVPDQDLLIGRVSESPEAMDGWMGKLQFYNFALSQTQVERLAGLGSCPADVDRSGSIGLSDIAPILSNWGQTCP